MPYINGSSSSEVRVLEINCDLTIPDGSFPQVKHTFSGPGIILGWSTDIATPIVEHEDSTADNFVCRKVQAGITGATGLFVADGWCLTADVEGTEELFYENQSSGALQITNTQQNIYGGEQVLFSLTDSPNIPIAGVVTIKIAFTEL